MYDICDRINGVAFFAILFLLASTAIRLLNMPSVWLLEFVTAGEARLKKEPWVRVFLRT